MLDTAELMIPDIRERLVFCEASTPITQERFTLTTDGNCYGIAPLLKNLGPFRPRVKTHIPGLFLAGNSTEHLFGINATMYGGMGTAGAVLGRDLVAGGARRGGLRRREPADPGHRRLRPAARLQARLGRSGARCGGVPGPTTSAQHL